MLREGQNGLRASILIVLALALGCNRYPDSYPPPEQHEPLAEREVRSAKSFVAMNDPDAESYFVRDIRGLEAGQWRWSGAEPTFHFVLDETRNLKFLLEFAIAGATFKDTGPVSLTVVINDHVLGETRYNEPGDYVFEAPVDPAWLESGGDTLVKVTIDPSWTSPDNTQLGVILARAGFVER